MFRPASPSAAGPGADNLRQRVDALMQQIKANPANQVPYLQLAHLYAQVWIKNQDANVMVRVVNCIRKAIEFEDGKHTHQFRQLLSGIAKQARALNHEEVVTQFKEFNSHLNAKVEALRDQPEGPTVVGGPKPDANVQVATTEAQPDAPPAPQTEAPPAPTPESALEPETAPANDSSSMPEPEIEIETVDSSHPSVAENSSSPLPGGAGDFQDALVEIETVGGPAPEEPEEDRRAVSQEIAVGTVKEMAQIDPLFEAGDLNEILRTYAGGKTTRVKRYIIDKLIENLAEWKIEPLLALAAMESDKQTFRYLMRALLKQNRSMICQQINLENYSSDLRQVAVVILGDLGLRATLPKLKKALDIDDPIVRCVALHGIGRMGKAAIRLVPTLVDTTFRDPDPNVRVGAAKALDSMNIEEAFDALDTKSHETNLGPAVQDILEEMRQKFDPQDTKHAFRKAKEKEKAYADKGNKKKNAAKGIKGSDAPSKTPLVVVILILMAAALAFIYRNQIITKWQEWQAVFPGDIPPPTETPVTQPTPPAP